ncbi:hypothetical protein CMK22_01805 [Candidatus Poribacteria bacterium]|nr:hypothetical protein [Candidatus Poribacteria bacterium]
MDPAKNFEIPQTEWGNNSSDQKRALSYLKCCQMYVTPISHPALKQQQIYKKQFGKQELPMGIEMLGASVILPT